MAGAGLALLPCGKVYVMRNGRTARFVLRDP